MFLYKGLSAPPSRVHLWTPCFYFLCLLLKNLSALHFHHLQLSDLRDQLLSDSRYAVPLVTINEGNLLQVKGECMVSSHHSHDGTEGNMGLKLGQILPRIVEVELSEKTLYLGSLS